MLSAGQFEQDLLHSFEPGCARVELPEAGPWLAGNEGMQKKHGKYCNGLCRDYRKDSFFHS